MYRLRTWICWQSLYTNFVNHSLWLTISWTHRSRSQIFRFQERRFRNQSQSLRINSWKWSCSCWPMGETIDNEWKPWFGNHHVRGNDGKRKRICSTCYEHQWQCKVITVNFEPLLKVYIPSTVNVWKKV